MTNDYFDNEEREAETARREEETERRRRFTPKGETMRQIGNYQFPELGNTIQVEAWRSVRTYRALNRNVLAAANTRIEGTWKAYCAAVPGADHTEEFDAVLKHGAEIWEELAIVMFPQFQGIPYAE